MQGEAASSQTGERHRCGHSPAVNIMQPFSSDRVRLGFVGVGEMGSRLVRRLRVHAYDVAVYDRDLNRAAALSAYGASVAGSLAELAKNADVIMSCLTDDDVVRNVCLGHDGILASKPTAWVVLEMSTISPKTTTIARSLPSG